MSGLTAIFSNEGITWKAIRSHKHYTALHLRNCMIVDILNWQLIWNHFRLSLTIRHCLTLLFWVAQSSTPLFNHLFVVVKPKGSIPPPQKLSACVKFRDWYMPFHETIFFQNPILLVWTIFIPRVWKRSKKLTKLLVTKENNNYKQEVLGRINRLLSFHYILFRYTDRREITASSNCWMKCDMTP
jgi:hypothetical protein